MTMTRRVGRAGFTLVETLITLVVAGVLGVAILTLILGQNRFYEHSDDAIYAQQTIRAAMDLMSSELRMISPTDLLAAEEDSLAARFDLVRGVVCDTLSSDDVYLFVYDSEREPARRLPGGRGVRAVLGDLRLRRQLRLEVRDLHALGGPEHLREQRLSGRRHPLERLPTGVGAR